MLSIFCKCWSLINREGVRREPTTTYNQFWENPKLPSHRMTRAVETGINVQRERDFQQAHWRPLKIRRLAPRPRGTHHDFCTQGHLGEEENIWEEKNSPEKAWECERDQVKILRWIIIKQNSILHCKWMIYLEGQKLELLKLFSVTEKNEG